MSSAPDPHGPDAHDAHAFTGEPVQVLSPDEPPSPGWLPPLGIALFTAAAVIFLVGRGSSQAAAQPEHAPAVVAPQPSPAAPPPTAPSPARTVTRLTPPPSEPPPPAPSPSAAAPSPARTLRLAPQPGQRTRTAPDDAKARGAARAR